MKEWGYNFFSFYKLKLTKKLVHIYIFYYITGKIFNFKVIHNKLHFIFEYELCEFDEMMFYDERKTNFIFNEILRELSNSLNNYLN